MGEIHRNGMPGRCFVELGQKQALLSRHYLKKHYPGYSLSIRYPTKTLTPAASAAKAANMVLISLFYLILFSCILYVGAAKVLQHDEKNHGILPVDKIRGLVIIISNRAVDVATVGSLQKF